MEKRYQVFVSSTFEDLKEERRAVIECLLNAKYIPAGMELFSASNDEQFEYIKKIIDTCDYYVLIIAARYGSINPSTGLSFTEQEYNYAKSKGIPILAFLHSDPYNLPYNNREDDKRELLEQFRKKASSGRLCKIWSDLAELTTSVLISLNEQVNENPQKGWIRNDAKNFSVDNGLIEQLNKDNRELKDEVKKLQIVISDLNLKLKASENTILDLNKRNEQLSVQLNNVNTVNADIKESTVIRYNNGIKECKLYITWSDILKKTGDDFKRGCFILDLNKCLSRRLIIGSGKIIDEDVIKIINYMKNNGLWMEFNNEIFLTTKGILALKYCSYYFE